MSFGFAQPHENATFGLAYELALQRNSDNHVLCHDDGTVAKNFTHAGRIILYDKRWYGSHFTPKIAQQNALLEHIVSRAASELTYFKRSSCKKKVITDIMRTSDLGVQRVIDVLVHVIVGVMQRDHINHQQKHN